MADKRVGVIGTGATAVQVVPALAETARELFVFQRTPAAVGVRDNGPTDVEWFKSLEPGWQQDRIVNFTQCVTGAQPAENKVGDAWTDIYWVDTKAVPSDEAEAAALEAEDFAQMEGIRRRVASIVEDPDTAAKLQPWYGKGCKRPCFHDEYLPAFNRPNVHLVDTDGRGVERINAHGVVVDGVEYPLDVLIYASGFEVTTDYHHRLGFDPLGRGGRSLSDAWADGAHTLHGVVARDFPNMLMISTVQGGYGTNFVHYLTETSRHVVALIETCRESGIRSIEPTEEAQEEWFGVLLGRIGGLGEYNASCTPGYLNNEQAAGDMKAARNTPFMGSVVDYAEYLERWRDAGDMAGLVVTNEAS